VAVRWMSGSDERSSVRGSMSRSSGRCWLRPAVLRCGENDDDQWRRATWQVRSRDGETPVAARRRDEAAATPAAAVPGSGCAAQVKAVGGKQGA
jgi:hypothetical protein